MDNNQNNKLSLIALIVSIVGFFSGIVTGIITRILVYNIIVSIVGIFSGGIVAGIIALILVHNSRSADGTVDSYAKTAKVLAIIELVPGGMVILGIILFYALLAVAAIVGA